MFDRSIVQTDNFADLSPSMIGVYFLFGIEADDEGFVSPKRIIRAYKISEDDVKMLILKGYFIAFNSGVIVITDWQENNYLDKKRIKPTQYQEEKKMLFTVGRKYVLNNGLTSIEEGRVEEGRVEEGHMSILDIIPISKDSDGKVVLETWLNEEAWKSWTLYRKEIRKKMTVRTVELQWKLLRKYSKEDQEEIINTSIRNGWTGLFEKSERSNNNQKKIYAPQ
jgi:hypothetical protein